MLNQSQAVKNRFDHESQEWFDNYNNEPKSIFQFDLQLRKELVLETVLDLAQENEFSRVVEIGCGSCNVIGEIPLKGSQKVGVDLSNKMLETGKKNYSGIALINGDTNFLPFKDDQFDMVLCLGVIQYINSYADAITEISRILKPDGYLILSVPSKHSVFNIYRKLWHHSPMYMFMKSLVYGVLKVDKVIRRLYKMHYFDISEVDTILSKKDLKKISGLIHTHGIMKTYRMAMLNRMNIKMSKMLERFDNPSFQKLTGWTYLTVSRKIL